jgi:tRNA A-37 threonylcarbamoyl transferase component Bud32
VTKLLGRGGMGAVYAAEHRVIGKRAAAKLMVRELAFSDEAVARFEQEARAAAALGHDNIVEIFDFGRTALGNVFILMEYLEGQSLADALGKDGPMPPSRVAPILRQIGEGLGAAHDRGIVHRDMKPDNVFLARTPGRGEVVKLLDFGIAKLTTLDAATDKPLTQTGMIVGTPHYMSPEQAEGRPVDQRSDVYSVGVILYQLLTGAVPFSADTLGKLMLKHVSEPPRPLTVVRPDLGIGAAVEDVVLRALVKDADGRWPSMRAFADAFKVAVRKDMAAGPPTPMVSEAARDTEVEGVPSPVRGLPLGSGGRAPTGATVASRPSGAPAAAAAPRPTPAAAFTPAPLGALTPAPSVAPTPAPAAPLTPSPPVALTPAPAAPLTPSPPVALTPAPAAPLTPSPSVALTPAPAAPLTPSPSPVAAVPSRALPVAIAVGALAIAGAILGATLLLRAPSGGDRPAATRDEDDDSDRATHDRGAAPTTPAGDSVRPGGNNTVLPALKPASAAPRSAAAAAPRAPGAAAARTTAPARSPAPAVKSAARPPEPPPHTTAPPAPVPEPAPPPRPRVADRAPGGDGDGEPETAAPPPAAPRSAKPIKPTGKSLSKGGLADPFGSK